jgi:glutathione S-transferase
MLDLPSPQTAALTLVSHPLCPYVQRAAIALAEKGVAFTRVDVDLAAKPDWFRAVSPLGKVPLLRVGDAVLFESAAIVDYLDETLDPPLHPERPLDRARHRGWIEIASQTLNRIAAAYAAPDGPGLAREMAALRAMFVRLEDALGDGPFFAGSGFSLVDAAFAPAFRYFDAFAAIGADGTLAGLAKVARWRAALAARPSVRAAVAPDYPERLAAFLRARPSVLGARARAAMAGVTRP